jgi:hypothetical protein
MKSCPQCRSTYSDDSLQYCLQDGAALVPVGTPEQEAETVNMPGRSDNAAEGKGVGPDDIREEVKNARPTPAKTDFMGGKRKWYAAAAGGVVVLALLSLVGYRFIKGSRAQKRFEEAQAVERSEGSLSQSACKKYSEIEPGSLGSSAAGELARKLNDCTNLQNLFQTAEKLEKDNGLDYETATAYREITAKFPGSAYEKQVAQKTSDFERNKQATVRAWNEIQELDGRFRAFGFQVDLRKDPINGVRALITELVNLANDYGKILSQPDSGYVDALVAGRVKEMTGLVNEQVGLFHLLERDWIEFLEVAKKRASEVTTESGRTEYERWVDQTTAEIMGKRMGSVKEIDERVRELNNADEEISSKLEKKYKVEFLDRH